MYEFNLKSKDMTNYNYDCQTDSVNDSILHCYQ